MLLDVFSMVIRAKFSNALGTRESLCNGRSEEGLKFLYFI